VTPAARINRWRPEIANPNPRELPENVDRVAIYFAMRVEGMGLVERLGLELQEPLDPDLPAVWYRGSAPGKRSGDRGGRLEVAIGFAGEDPIHGCDRIGTVPATLTAYLLCRRFKPDLLVNAGTCGGFQRAGASVGDIYVGGRDLLFHDRRIPLPRFDEFGIGRIPATTVPGHLSRSIDASPGVISTGDSFTPTSEEEAFFAAEEVCCKEMEAATIAGLSRDLGIPFLAVKAVTDLVDHPEPEQDAFQRNLEHVSERLQDRLAVLLGHL
jgi:5'-methylthioadenosine nucleosidase